MEGRKRDRKRDSEEAFAVFIAAHTAEEAEDILANGGVPCSRLMDYEAARNHPHYQARGVIAEWLACDDESVIPGVKVVPDLANHPGRVWRGAPATGQDNEDVLGELASMRSPSPPCTTSSSWGSAPTTSTACRGRCHAGAARRAAFGPPASASQLRAGFAPPRRRIASGMGRRECRTPRRRV